MLNLSNKTWTNLCRMLTATVLLLFGLWGLAYGITAHQVSAQSHPESELVVRITLNGSIDGVSSRFIDRGLDFAADNGAELAVIVLDTPGGLLDATRDIVESIMDSDVPVAVYVAPIGAQAASAGTFIGASAHILAMSPATNIGAASVVGAMGEDLPETLSDKAAKDAAAFMRSIAEQRGRNVDALESSVISADSYSSTEALDSGIADLIAADYDSLLELLDGVEVQLNDDISSLELKSVITSNVDFTVLESFLSFISNPNIAFLLISIGGLGLIVEIWNPGLWVPGTLGLLFLVTGWAGVGQMPFSWAGVALIVLAGLLFYLESTAAGLGYFGVAAVICLILGGVFLVGFFGSPIVYGDVPIVNRWLLAAIGVGLGSIVLWLALELRRSREVILYESPNTLNNLIGSVGVAQSKMSPSGQVLLNGEYWSGEVDITFSSEISYGTEVEVVSVDGNHLTVKPSRNVQFDRGGASEI